MIRLNKKILFNLLIILFLFLVFPQVVQAVIKGIGEIATVEVICSDSNGNLTQCNVTSPCTQTCLVFGFISSCSCQYTCLGPGTFNACGQARDAQGETDSSCLDSVICNNFPNVPSDTNETWDNCTFQELSLPIFYWTYSDPDGDPQQAYEIRIDDDSNFAIQDPEEITASGGSSVAYTPLVADWRDLASWNTNYWWIVRVQDDQGNWSDWSDVNIFTTPNHAYPWPDFNWTPEEPTEEEVVIFNPDLTQVYGGASISNYLWTIVSGTGEYVGTTTNISQYPNILFSTIENTIKLQVTDSSGYSCESSENIISVTLPLPEYKEVPPAGWLYKIFSIIFKLFRV